MMRRTHPNLKWREWVARWDRMQERYLVARSERFGAIAGIIRATQTNPRLILDLGCGTGTLSLFLLTEFPGARTVGLDVDPALLPLANARAARFSGRARFLQLDLRDSRWTRKVPRPVDAVVSATALHWLSALELRRLYRQVLMVLKRGGIFLNADHVGSTSPLIQESWTRQRSAALRAEHTGRADSWDEFWSAYFAVLGPEARKARERALGQWRGIEPGLPLTWQFDALRRCGFSSVDCFWRHACDAIYGGLKEE